MWDTQDDWSKTMKVGRKTADFPVKRQQPKPRNSNPNQGTTTQVKAQQPKSRDSKPSQGLATQAKG